MEENIKQERIEKLITFIKEADKLKHVDRAVYTSEQNNTMRKENSAEHSWHLALMTVVLREYFPNLNQEKILRMSLIHDLVEIYAGDTPIFDIEKKKTQEEREKKAAEELFSLLPHNLKLEFTALFFELEAEETAEAKIVKSCDKIHGLLQNIITKGRGWKENNVSLEFIHKFHEGKHEHNEPIKQLYQYLAKEVQEKNLIEAPSGINYLAGYRHGRS